MSRNSTYRGSDAQREGARPDAFTFGSNRTTGPGFTTAFGTETAGFLTSASASACSTAARMNSLRFPPPAAASIRENVPSGNRTVITSSPTFSRAIAYPPFRYAFDPIRYAIAPRCTHSGIGLRRAKKIKPREGGSTTRFRAPDFTPAPRRAPGPDRKAYPPLYPPQRAPDLGCPSLDGCSKAQQSLIVSGLAVLCRRLVICPTDFDHLLTGTGILVTPSIVVDLHVYLRSGLGVGRE